jgi:hypothetical protein
VVSSLSAPSERGRADAAAEFGRAAGLVESGGAGALGAWIESQLEKVGSLPYYLSDFG